MIMKTIQLFFARLYKIIAVVLMAGSFTVQMAVAQGWYDANYEYRSLITIPNPGTTELFDFQVQVKLDKNNFDFSAALNDGSDIRLTSSDGTTLIPFWIESWSSVSGSIWVKIPSLPVSGATAYLYYGNPAPTIPSSTPVDTPPVGPFTRVTGNPINPIGAEGRPMLAENIVLDPNTGRYWMCAASYSPPAASIFWSDTPTDPTSWTWSGDVITPVISSGVAPHLVLHDNTWYLFYSDKPNIMVASSTTGAAGPYTINPTPALVRSGLEWDIERVDEPFVFQRGDGTWVLIYMGDSDTESDYFSERIGYATASTIMGPYTAYTGNPVIDLGDSYDHGTVADPWVYLYNGLYYIGYTVCGTGHSPWQMALATTSDWVTFTKHGIIFPLAAQGWDAANSFRGSVIRIGDQYLLTYTGGSGEVGNPYQMGLATQPVIQAPPTIINNPDAVFDFYDSFDGIALNSKKWTVMNGFRDMADPGEGLLTMTANGIYGSQYIRIFGNTSFDMNYIQESRAQHLDEGGDDMFMQVGFNDYSFSNMTRIIDNEPTSGYWRRQAFTGGYGDYVNMQTADADWHLFRVFRQGSSIAGFKIDDNPYETVTIDVPTISLPPYLMSSGVGNRAVIDWIRVRKWAGSDPVAVVGPGLRDEQVLSTWTGAAGSAGTGDWNTPGNWLSGVLPGSEDYIVIPEADNYPTCTNLTIGANSTLSIEAGGSLTVVGDLNIAGNFYIESSGLTSGSLIVGGSSTGTVTFNRQMRTESNDGDYHYFSSPVLLNTETNSSKVSTVWRWVEETDSWITLTDMTVLQSGWGYNLDQTPESDGIISFTGSVQASDVPVDVTSPYDDVIINGTVEEYAGRSYADGSGHSQAARDDNEHYGAGGWNMLGNPYTSSIDASAFVNYPGNLQNFEPNYQAVYLYDGAYPGHNRFFYIGNDTGWGTPTAETHIQAGQGFFVIAMNDYSTFTFTRLMQAHRPSAVFLKSAGAGDRWPGLQLKAKSGDYENLATIVFNEEMTAGLDPGYDIGHMGTSPGAVIYSTLVEDNGFIFTRQALPLTGSEKSIIPVGIDFVKGGKVTLSADIEPIKYYKFWLEDRETGIFTDLGNKEYTVTIPPDTYGTGRFFIHVSTGRSVGPRPSKNVLHGVRIWSTQDRQVFVQGAVSEKATCEVFNTQGQKVFEISLKDGDYNSFVMKSASRGVYLVKVTDGLKIITGKVVFP